MLRMVFHSRVTNSHHCHDMFQLLIQTECRNAYIQNDNQRGAGQRGACDYDPEQPDAAGWA